MKKLKMSWSPAGGRLVCRWVELEEREKFEVVMIVLNGWRFSCVRYRVREPLLAVRNEPGMEGVFMTIEPDSLITVTGKEQQSGFVDVSYDGQVVKVYTRDIEKRADRL